MKQLNDRLILRPALLGIVCLSVGFFCPATMAQAQSTGTISPVQSPADPLGLKIIGPVLQRGSSAASASFDNTLLPGALAYINANLPERVNNSKSKAVTALDPSKLVLKNSVDMQAVFVSEGAGYHNTLGINTAGVGTSSGNPQIIFPDASSNVGAGLNSKGVSRSSENPLLPGDFVDLGTFAAGTKLDFFLMANAVNGGKDVYTTGSNASNPDGLRHAGTFAASMFAIPLLNSPYIFISFEDTFHGGDKDYNDVVFAVNVGIATVQALTTAPEPSLYLTLGGFLALAIWTKSRLDRRQLICRS